MAVGLCGQGPPALDSVFKDPRIQNRFKSLLKTFLLSLKKKIIIIFFFFIACPPFYFQHVLSVLLLFLFYVIVKHFIPFNFWARCIYWDSFSSCALEISGSQKQ